LAISRELVKYRGKIYWWDEWWQELQLVENPSQKIPFTEVKIEEVEFLGK
jgi:hypothetical protein